jgi:GNAT superfamily N-acetyltransferase
MTPAITVQPFTADHASTPFTCGGRRIDDYFAQGAHIQKERLAPVFIALDRPARRTPRAAIGFRTLYNMDIEADVVPPPPRAKLRRNRQVSAVYIAMLAVASNHQGKGLGSLLLANAVKRIKRLRDDSGIWAVVLAALNDRAHEFYVWHRFLPLIPSQRRLFLPLGSIACGLGWRRDKETKVRHVTKPNGGSSSTKRP